VSDRLILHHEATSNIMNAQTARLVSTITIASMIALVGCKKGESYGDTTAATTAKDTAAAIAAAPSSNGLTDANIAAILDAANESDSAFGAMAVKKARASDVKQFGRLMMGEHHALRLAGQQLVKKLNVTPAAPANFDMPDKQRSAMEDLNKKTGDDFDKAYIDHEVDFHQEVLDTATKALAAAQNQELKDLIQKAAPVIQKHLIARRRFRRS